MESVGNQVLGQHLSPAQQQRQAELQHPLHLERSPRVLACRGLSASAPHRAPDGVTTRTLMQKAAHVQARLMRLGARAHPHPYQPRAVAFLLVVVGNHSLLSEGCSGDLGLSVNLLFLELLLFES